MLNMCSTQENNKINSDLFNKCFTYVKQFLNQGRFGWDLPHTKSVIFYAYNIAKKEKADVTVLTLAAMFHDIGYFKLFKKGQSDNAKNITDKKKQHMVNGSKMVKEFFNNNSGFFDKYITKKQQERIIHLVYVHDNVLDLKQKDELILMEADTLGAIDVTRLKPNFNIESVKKYIKGFHNKRAKMFKTKSGKEFLNKLLPKFYSFYKSQKGFDLEKFAKENKEIVIQDFLV